MSVHEIVDRVAEAFGGRRTVLTDAVRTDEQTGVTWRTYQVRVPAADNAGDILRATVLPLLAADGWTVTRRAGGASFARDGIDVGVLIGRSVVVGGSSEVWNTRPVTV